MSEIDQNRRQSFLPKSGQIVYLTLSDGAIIRTGYFPATGDHKATVLLLNGHREFIEKYSEFIEDLQKRGFDVYSMDHRGQGLSSRALKNRSKSHNPDFDKLVADIDQLVQEKIKPDQLNQPFYIIAHSMGAHLALRYLAEYPGPVSKAVLLSPLTDLNHRARLHVWLLKIFFKVMNVLGFNETFALGQAKTDDMINHKQAFSKLTHDETRYNWSQDAISDNADLFVGGITYGGAAEMVESLDKLSKPGYLDAINIPILCLLSEDEQVVNNRTTISIMENIETATLKIIPGARHEMYREVDEIRDQLLQKIDEFLGP